MTKSILLLMVTAIAMMMHQTEALECYVCAVPNLSADNGCRDDFNTAGPGVTTEVCDGNFTYPMCSKLRSYSGSGVTRGCADMDVKTGCREEFGIWQCYCNDDLCNSAPSLISMATVTMATISLITSFVIKKSFSGI